MLRRAVNVLTQAREQVRGIRANMRGHPEDAIRRECREQVWQPVNQLKRALATLQDAEMPEHIAIARQQLQPFFDVYGDNFDLGEHDIYYDAVANPLRHLAGYYMLARILEQTGQPAMAMLFVAPSAQMV
ncbi:hypothetical protein EV183_000496 [Coemansia sp. RSA 2336]|nr:hypothetical protein EV183_000496 [Coemansia sp. RSA 2336]